MNSIYNVSSKSDEIASAWTRVHAAADNEKSTRSMTEVRDGLVNWSETNQHHALVVVAQSLASEGLVRAHSAEHVPAAVESLIARLAAPSTDAGDRDLDFGSDYRRAIKVILAGSGLIH